VQSSDVSPSPHAIAFKPLAKSQEFEYKFDKIKDFKPETENNSTQE